MWFREKVRGIDLSVARFVIVGLANTLFGLAVIYLAMGFGELNVVAANVLGYGLGLTLSFSMNKRWTFGDHGPVLPSLLRFVSVIVLAYSVNLLVVVASLKFLEWNRYVAQAAGIVPYAGIVYVGSRFFAFSSRKPRAGDIL